MKEASFYTKLEDKKVACSLCPHNCLIIPDKYGICKARKNHGGTLAAETYGRISSMNFDPIEKKPLYHFYPGSTIFSIGSTGCNMHCGFCQNCEISQAEANSFIGFKILLPEQLIQIMQQRPDNIGLAYTYNEPSIWFEYVFESAILVKNCGYKNVAVTNGYFNPEPLRQLLEVIDAFNVDLKAFTDTFYKQQSRARIEPVLETLKAIRKSGRHLEITNLVIPTLNDNPNDFEAMCKWICNELGKETVLHLSRYFPKYKLTIESTPVSTLEELYSIATSYLRYVYLGNCQSKQRSDTACVNCSETLIKRDGYSTRITGILDNMTCSSCSTPVDTMGIIL
jgi:pyruvate formate lyase activating enzyme